MKKKVFNFIVSIAWILSFYFVSCDKEIPEQAPIPEFTIGFDSITENSAVCIINITYSKNSTFYKGIHVCTNPEFSTTYFEYRGTESQNNVKIRCTDLVPNTVYYLRAFATDGDNYREFFSKTISFVTVPQINTTLISEITKTTAKSGGSFEKVGNASIIDKGICWGTVQNPSITGNKTAFGTGVTDFAFTITGLLPNTCYYVRAYVINNKDTVYGQQRTFVTYSNNAIYDIDNNIYNVVEIGTQVWMKEDLRTTHYSNGDLILTASFTSSLNHENMPKYLWTFQDNDINISKVSRLYTWYAATDSRGVCPVGWHIPNESDWDLLTSYLGGQTVAGGKMKESGTIHWDQNHIESSNESGFTALSVGYQRADGYTVIPYYTGVFYWSSTEANSESAWIRKLESHNTYIGKFYQSKKNGFTCRCIKD